MMFKTHAIASLFLVGAFAGCAGARVGITEGGGNSGNGGGGGGAGSSGLVINLDAKAPLSNQRSMAIGLKSSVVTTVTLCISSSVTPPLKNGTIPAPEEKYPSPAEGREKLEPDRIAEASIVAIPEPGR